MRRLRPGASRGWGAIKNRLLDRPESRALSSSEITFVLLALTQSVIAIVWLLGAWFIVDLNGAVRHWALSAGFSALSFGLLAMSVDTADPLLILQFRAASNIVALLSLLSLRHGVRRFIERPPTRNLHLLAFFVALCASWAGRDTDGAYLRVGIIAGLIALLSLGLARDLYVYARNELDWRRPVLLVLPVLFGALGYASRSAQALLHPATVSTAISANEVLNVVSALVLLALALATHAMLIALVVARLLGQLRHQSRHDGLTGLLNRRGLEEALAHQRQRSTDKGECFAVMAIDADHFKRINDEFGHAIGDLALKHLARLLLGGLRDSDRLVRAGGEEFIVLLPGATLPSAAPVAERLRQIVAAEALLHEKHRIPLSISIGLAQSGAAEEDPQQVIVRADEALYRAKQQGRDRVVLSTGVPARHAAPA